MREEQRIGFGKYNWTLTPSIVCYFVSTLGDFGEKEVVFEDALSVFDKTARCAREIFKAKLDAIFEVIGLDFKDESGIFESSAVVSKGGNS